jgi:hypothetical protein
MFSAGVGFRGSGTSIGGNRDNRRTWTSYSGVSEYLELLDDSDEGLRWFLNMYSCVYY